MAKRFEVSEFAKTLAAPVSDPDTREQIEYIDIDLLDSDPKNFYSLSGLDELAANIATIGLQQPIRVRDGEDGHVVIVSGHRRAAAIRQLVADDGRSDLRQVPCIRERQEGSEALRELRLLYANADTRRMTPAETSQQALRVEMLLYQLKEEGYDFPGRMRDHVAEACKISTSKLARLKAIENNLAPNLKAAYWNTQKGAFSEATAYALSQLPPDDQQTIVSEYRTQNRHDPGCQWLTEGRVNKIADALKLIDALKCADGAPCPHIEGKKAHVVRAIIKDQWMRVCCGQKCCGDCPRLDSCRDVCAHHKATQKQLKAAARESSAAAKAVMAEQRRPQIEAVTKIWRRFGELRKLANLTPPAYGELVGAPYASYLNDMAELEAGKGIEPNTDLPFGYNVTLTHVKRIIAAADVLGCTVDYLFCRDTEEPALRWRSGNELPEEPCDAVADFLLDESLGTIRELCRWNGWSFCFRGGGDIDLPLVRWLALPDTVMREGVMDDGTDQPDD